MPTAKFTCQRGKVDLKDITLGTGTAEAQSETVSVNIDYTNMTKQDALIQIDEIKQRIFNAPWPPL